MATKRKFVTGLVAGVTAAALLLGGTFAWTSISQEAKNEAAGIVNVGGRLHDDFNGTNKDVYVENFTDPLNGGQPIYARVRLDEYMEVGSEAGQADNANRKATPVVANTDINDVKTWTPHVPDTSCAACATEGTCVIHEHWTWTMGGDNGSTGQTVFMPTFNKDKDSLKADINGTYAGTNPTDKVYYDDYVTYVTEGGLTVDMADENFTAPEGATTATPLTEATGDVTSVIGTEYYDDDTDTEDNGGTRQVADVTHTAKQTATAKVITMTEWLQNPVPGNYWVYDEDGWAYWANPIMPGEATGLLLDGIKMEKNPGEKCYYAINVVAQFATVGDWTYFTKEGETDFDGTDNAKTLLETASKNVATVVVTNVSGTTLLTPSSSYEFSANVYVNNVAKYAASDFEWSVLNADGSENTKSSIAIDAEGKAMLTVGESETAKNLVIVAKAINSDYLGALGMTSVAVDVKDYSIAVLSKTVDDGEGGTYEESWPGYMEDNSSWTMQLMVGDTPITEGVTWSSELIASNPTDNEFLEGTGIDASTGVFTVAEGEVTWQSGQYTSNAWHVVEVTASVEGEEPVKERFYLGAYFGVEGLKFYEAGTLNAVSESSLVVGTEYDTRIRMWCQNTYTDAMTDYMNPISFEGATVTVTDREGNPTDKATWVDGKFVATEAGEYIVNLTKEDAVYGTIGGQDYITVISEFDGMVNNINSAYYSESTVTIDGMNWYVLSIDETENKALIWAAEQTETKQVFGSTNIWRDSGVRTWLNNDYLTSLTLLKDYAIPTTIKTADAYDRSTCNYIETEDTVFLLSEADLFGTANGTEITNENEYTLGTVAVLGTEAMRVNSDNWLSWLRSPFGGETHVAILTSEAKCSLSSPDIQQLSVRPAMWVSLDADYSAE